MIILGIESSCDETAAAIIHAESNKPLVELVSNVTATSLQLHARTGGIIPEIAAREQIKFTIPVITEALRQAGIKEKNIDAIAVTYGPGLIGSLLVGVETARTLAYVWNKPLIPVNHLIGHIYANWLVAHGSWHALSAIHFPAIALVVSGGHTDLVLMKGHNDIQWLGGTRDDAAGEAIDKTGRSLHFPYPSGPAFERAAFHGNPKAYRFPRPVMYDGNYDFSFSGLKTAALREIQKHPHLGWKAADAMNITNSSNKPHEVTDQDRQIINDIARGVQDAIIDVLTYKTVKAAEEYVVSSIVLSGGVAANGKLREVFQQKIAEKQLPVTFYVPDKSLCTDNAAMIAAAGFYNYNPTRWTNITANPELYFD